MPVVPLKQGRCESCKWWEGEPITYLGSRRRCDPDNLTDCVNDAVGVDGEYACETPIYTSPNFGCIHWERKDEPPRERGAQ